MCNSETSVIAIDEQLLRRIDPVWCRMPKHQGKPLATSFFTPKPADIDGLSVSRASITPYEIACKTAKGKPWALAQFAVKTVLDLNMTVLPKPIHGGDQGHAIIPELNHTDLTSSIIEIENFILEMADAIAESSKIVWQPSSLPCPEG